MNDGHHSDQHSLGPLFGYVVRTRDEASIARVMRDLKFDRETAIKHLKSLAELRARLHPRRQP